MSSLKPSEEKFEDYIEKRLISLGFNSKHFDQFDRNLCLIKDDVINFIKKTQIEKWEKLQSKYGEETENNILKRISSEISSRGIIDVLKNKIKDRGQYLDLCYFQPNSFLNPLHLKLYKENNFTVC